MTRPTPGPEGSRSGLRRERRRGARNTALVFERIPYDSRRRRAAEVSRERPQAVADPLLDDRQSFLGPRLVALEERGVRELENRRLDRAERGEALSSALSDDSRSRGRRIDAPPSTCELTCAARTRASRSNDRSCRRRT